MGSPDTTWQEINREADEANVKYYEEEVATQIKAAGQKFFQEQLEKEVAAKIEHIKRTHNVFANIYKEKAPPQTTSYDQAEINRLNFELGQAHGTIAKMTNQYAEAMRLLAQQNSDAPAAEEYQKLREERDMIANERDAFEKALISKNRMNDVLRDQLDRAEKIAQKTDYMGYVLEKCRAELGNVKFEGLIQDAKDQGWTTF